MGFHNKAVHYINNCRNDKCDGNNISGGARLAVGRSRNRSRSRSTSMSRSRSRSKSSRSKHDKELSLALDFLLLQ